MNRRKFVRCLGSAMAGCTMPATVFGSNGCSKPSPTIKVIEVGVHGFGYQKHLHVRFHGVPGIDSSLHIDSDYLRRDAIANIPINCNPEGSVNESNMLNLAVQHKILGHFADSDAIVIVVDLGRRFGVAFASAIAKLAQQNGILVVAVIRTPFDFEGSRLIVRPLRHTAL